MGKKKYIYNISNSKVNRTYGGRKETAKIYRVKNNKPIYVGETSWNTSGYKGEESEVYTKLKNEKEVSKKDFEKDKGYYRPNNSKVEIFKV